MIVGIALAQFMSVFALVMSSKLLRDDRWILAGFNSWLITATQFVFVLAVAHSTNVAVTFIASGIGGSLGCVCSHLFYTKYILRKRDDK